MRVRLMAAGDATEVAGLCEQLGYAATPAQVAHRLGLLEERGDGVVYVAETEDGDDGEDGRVVGWVQVHGQALLLVDAFAEIGGLVVERRWRGQGIGRRLMEAAESWARGRGYDELRLRSHTAREGAHAFYERLGFAHGMMSVRFTKEL